MDPKSSLHNWRSTVSDYWTLTKPEVNVLVLASTLAGFYLGSRGPLSGLRLTHTLLCTLVGAFPGAMPPLIGWAAARGSLSREAWVLYAVLFLWQFPHFLGIAWMYREDYARAGYVMLPPKDVEGRFTGREIFAFTLLL